MLFIGTVAEAARSLPSTVRGELVADQKAEMAAGYRKQAGQIFAEAEKASREEDKRALIGLANVWLELARRAEDPESP